MPASTSSRSFWVLAALVVCLLFTGVAMGALVVGNGPLPAPFPDPPPVPDPNLYPVDYMGSAPDYSDTSMSLPWPGGFSEPGPHFYDPQGKVIHIANAFSQIYVKTVWMHLVFPPGGGWPNPPQPHDEVVNPALWGVATADGGTPTLTGASWEQSPLGTLHVYQTWTISPQPYSENINIAAIVATAGGQPSLVNVRTVCTPEPGVTLAGLALAGLLLKRRE